MADPRVAVVGATGAVGQEMMEVLENRNFPVGELVPLASERSRGKKVKFRGEEVDIQVLGRDSFKDVQLALFSAGGSISKELGPVAVESGAVVVDNSSAFRMDPEVPLVVPEVNPTAIGDHKGLIANPNCSTIIMVVALAPVHALSPIQRVTVSTYQAASGAGAQGMYALQRELAGETLEKSPFPHRLSGNLIPRIDTVMEGDYTREELKMVFETRKIMGLDDIPISATCVRVPVVRTHSESVQVTTKDALDLADIRAAFDKADGVQVQDDPRADVYPTPLAVTGQDDVFIGRLRRAPDEANVYDMWVVGDQLLKGAALNAVQIAERLNL